MSTSKERGRLAEGVTLSHKKQIELVLILKAKRYSNKDIANIMRIDENTVRTLIEENMTTEDQLEINWGYNCLTQGVHHGRPDSLWNIPLNYAIKIFSKDTLKTLVISRIYSDAMQFVERSPFEQKGTGATVVIDKAWADRVKKFTEEKYDRTLQHKVGEISQYYNHPSFALEMERTADRLIEDKLNWGYQPLHPHDTINMLCRILGVSSSIKASEGV